MTDTADDAPAEAPVETEASNESVVADMANDSPETDFSFVLDKYRSDERSDTESAFEQAKAYSELQSKFGSFTGAPEEYDVALSDGLADKFSLDDFSDDPILEDAKAMAKEWGMNNDGFNQMVDLYFKGQAADLEAADGIREEEIASLGKNAERRLSNIQEWSKVNLDADNAQGLIDGLTSAKTVQAVEALIAKTRNVQQVQSESTAPAVSAEQLRSRMSETDQFGNPKMNDPAFRKETDRLYGLLYGEEDYKVTLGR
jgi:hypothetical protein